jgi:hypothetical protein
MIHSTPYAKSDQQGNLTIRLIDTVIKLEALFCHVMSCQVYLGLQAYLGLLRHICVVSVSPRV